MPLIIILSNWAHIRTKCATTSNHYVSIATHFITKAAQPGVLTLLPGDVGFVPELGGVLHEPGGGVSGFRVCNVCNRSEPREKLG